MKSKVKLLNENLSEITTEVNKLLREKFGISGVRVNEMHFSSTSKCQPGFEKFCEFFGNDENGNPIIKCKCVPKQQV